jgi:hypothetical protein
MVIPDDPTPSGFKQKVRFMDLCPQETVATTSTATDSTFDALMMLFWSILTRATFAQHRK